jgi:hypothetical protein
MTGNVGALIISLWLLMLTSGCAMGRAHLTPQGESVFRRGNVTLSVPTQGFTIVRSQVGGLVVDPYVLATNDSTGVSISASLEAPVDGDCRQHFWRQLEQMDAFKPQDVRRESRGQFQVVEYTLRESPDPRLSGVVIDQRNAVGCATREAATAFVHVSKIKWTSEDEALFVTLFDQVRVDEQLAIPRPLCVGRDS